MPTIELAKSVLQETLGDRVLSITEFRDQTTVELAPEAVPVACETLRDHPELQFNFLAGLTAVDYLPNEPRFAVVYQLYSLSNAEFITLRTSLQSAEAHLSTVETIYPNANWHERELFDMFGIQFDGHSDLRRILMPHDWEGHPLRKDYPLGYEEVQFSFNFDEIDKRKPYAKE